MTEQRLSVAALGTREQVIKVDAALLITAGAGATNTLAVTFTDAFVHAPEIIGVVCTDANAIKANFAATDITTTGMNVISYQVLEADIADGTYIVEVSLVGQKAA